MNTPSKLTALALLASVAAGSASAQTVAYWRFEGDSTARLTDSSGNGRTLNTVTGHSNSTTQVISYALPETGPGSKFFDPVPQTGATNTQAFQKAVSGSNGGYFQAADHASFTSNTLTLEAMVHFTTRTTSLAFIAGHFDGGSNQRSYALVGSGTGVNPENNKLAFIVSSTGNNTGVTTYYSNFTITTGIDYYFGVAMDLTGATAAERSLTFYFQDLTNGGTLQSQTISGITQSAINDSAASFAIGAQGAGGSHAAWTGLIDEVRLSNVALGSNQLLVAIPEASSFAAFAGLGVLGLAATRRRRRA
jgi:hypothetical protein